MVVRGEGLVVVLVALGSVAALVFLGSLWLAARSRRPPARRPPRKTFEHGRRLARVVRAADTEAALRALEAMPVGHAASVRAAEGRVEVVVRRRRGQPCIQAAGYLAGLFESAWAHEVVVAHPACAGEGAGDCAYVIERAPGAIASGAPEGGASTRGSEASRRRSPPARSGGA